MNVLYIHTHDTGRYIEPYGYPVSTPNLLELARSSTLFRNAYCAAPTCSPSRSALLTGQYPHVCGMLGLAHRGFRLNDHEKHLARFLSRHGYETVLSGFQHEGLDMEELGYSRIITDFSHPPGPDWDRDNALRVADYLKQPKEKPFFISFGMFSTHRPFPEIDPEINPDYVNPPFPLADNKETRADMAAFLTSVRAVDQCTAIVLEALEQSGHMNDTLIIFTTDHGIPFPEMKCNLYDTGIGVSLMVKFPGNKLSGVVLDELVSQIDLFPTICELLGLEKPGWLQGVPIAPLLTGAGGSYREEIFAEVNYHAAYEPMRCVRTERYKYIKFFDDHSNIVPSNIDDGLSKSFIIDGGYLARSRPKEMLFDLYLDPLERVNLVGDRGYLAVYEDLKARLSRWMEDTGDPLLQGKVPPPEGTRVNKLSCLSAEDEDYE